MNDRPNGGLMEVESSAQCRLTYAAIEVKATYFIGILFGYFSLKLGFKRMTTLFDGIAHIVELSSRKQMVRSNTSWRVALVKYTFAFLKWTKVHNPRSDMRSDVLSAKIYLPVSVIRKRSGPQPARFGLGNLAPKSELEIFGKKFSLNLLNIIHSNLGQALGCVTGTARAFSF